MRNSQTEETENGPWVSRIASWLGREKPDLGYRQVLSGSVGLFSAKNLRAENQDRVVVARNTSPCPPERFLLFIVCDGIGGLANGGGCADWAIALLCTKMAESNGRTIHDQFTRAIVETNRQVFQKYRGKSGTTMSAIFVPQDGPVIALNIGDSRIYRYKDGESIEQVTIDDNLGSQLKLLNPNVAISAPVAIEGQLVQFVGMEEDVGESSFQKITKTDASYIVTTDGAHSIPVLEQIVVNSPNALTLVTRIGTLAKWLGTQDNSSMIALLADLCSLQQSLRTSNSSHLTIWDPFGELTVISETGPRGVSPTKKRVIKSKNPAQKQNYRSRDMIGSSQPHHPSEATELSEKSDQIDKKKPDATDLKFELLDTDGKHSD